MAVDSEKTKFSAKTQFTSRFYNDIEQFNHFATSYQVLFTKISPQAKKDELEGTGLDEQDAAQIKTVLENLQYYTVKIKQTIPSMVKLFNLKESEKTLKEQLKALNDDYTQLMKNYVIEPTRIQSFLTHINLFLVTQILDKLSDEEQNDFAQAFN